MNFDDFYKEFSRKLQKLVPESELRYKAEIAYEIIRLKQERNALILGHNYMEPALFHSIPDYVGDSLELSRIAAKTDRSIIIFCGVRFMAETAKILAPGKTVLIPSPKSGCSLADGITAEDVRKLKKKFPGITVVAYINTTAEVKAEVDICCTSSNAVAVVKSLGDEPVIFVPDEYLARNVANETNRKTIFPSLDDEKVDLKNLKKTIIGWRARCEVHEKFTVDDIRNARKQFPGVSVLAHPECNVDVVSASDSSGSTSRMIEYVKKTSAPAYLLLTECSMGDNIIASNPEKNILRLCSVRCPHMNEITLEQTLESLMKTQYVVEVPEEIRIKAKMSLERMLNIKPQSVD